MESRPFSQMARIYLPKFVFTLTICHLFRNSPTYYFRFIQLLHSICYVHVNCMKLNEQSYFNIKLICNKDNTVVGKFRIRLASYVGPCSRTTESSATPLLKHRNTLIIMIILTNKNDKWCKIQNKLRPGIEKRITDGNKTCHALF